MIENNKTEFGAKAEEWAHWDTILGLGIDLLPVVSDPNVRVSPTSRLTSLGKVPSIYKNDGTVVGLGRWSGKNAVAAEIERWSKVPGYGICLQTRLLRALDVDIVDKERAARVVAFVERYLSRKLPWRSRSNSGKVLCLFKLEGTWAKRKVEVEGGIIEFLANNQQCVVAGTHPSGARYEWLEGLPEIVEVTVGEFEGLWGAIVKEFGKGPSIESKSNDANLSGFIPCKEDINPKLIEKLHILHANNRRFDIVCPFFPHLSDIESGKREEDSGSSTSYFFPGRLPDGRYIDGHFKCQHASCASKSGIDFENALRVIEEEFEDVVIKGDEEGVVANLPLPQLARRKNGDILATLPNLYEIMSRPDLCETHIRFDEFRGDVVMSKDEKQWVPVRDTDYINFRLALEKKGFLPIGRELMRDTVRRIGADNLIDTAKIWLNSLEWDGVSRVDKFLETYLKTKDEPYSVAVSRYIWTALAGRILEPGVKADMVPVLVGAQGIGKSTAIAALVPEITYYDIIDLAERDSDLMRKMKGRLVLEIGEMRGLYTKDMAGVKDFLTRAVDSWIPKYHECPIEYKRRSLFIGTTNVDDFLEDSTGNRRWLPVKCPTQIDVKAIGRDRNQLWAEARLLYQSHGISWQDSANLALDVHEDHRAVSVWEDYINEYLNTPGLDGKTPIEVGDITIQELAINAIGLASSNINMREQKAIGNILRQLGFVREQKLIGDIRKRVWVKRK